MCDTLVIRGADATWFAKNSDREPDEPQRVEVHLPVHDDRTARLRCTHIDIPQRPDRLGVILSRPDWMWGAEMGVNTAGVAIGNEAIFSRRVMRRGAALLGMDLVRLGLERGGSAREACSVITALLETHGPGGPSGYRDKGFRYDNSFLIADAGEALVLETCGRDWVVKPVADAWAISNTYTLTEGLDSRSQAAPAEGFGGTSETWLRPYFGCAQQRIGLSQARIGILMAEGPSLAGLAEILRSHAAGDGFSGGSNRDLCMHASGPLRPSQTTGSMIVKLTPGAPPRIAITGARTPCISLFRPVDFTGSWSVCAEGYWEACAARHGGLNRDLAAREQWRDRIAELEAQCLPLIETGQPDLAEAWLRDQGVTGVSGSNVTAAAASVGPA